MHLSANSFFLYIFQVFYNVMYTFTKNKRHNILFIGKLKNPINRKLSICSLKNITILFQDNFRNLFIQVHT
jgi:hypothetical protein